MTDHDQQEDLKSLSQAYRAAPADDGPPPALDDAIRAAARRAVHSRPHAAGKSWFSRSATPLAAAAVVMLTVSIGFLGYDDPEVQQLAKEEAPRAAVPQSRVEIVPPPDAATAAGFAASAPAVADQATAAAPPPKVQPKLEAPPPPPTYIPPPEVVAAIPPAPAVFVPAPPAPPAPQAPAPAPVVTTAPVIEAVQTPPPATAASAPERRERAADSADLLKRVAPPAPAARIVPQEVVPPVVVPPNLLTEAQRNSAPAAARADAPPPLSSRAAAMPAERPVVGQVAPLSSSGQRANDLLAENKQKPQLGAVAPATSTTPPVTAASRPALPMIVAKPAAPYQPDAWIKRILDLRKDGRLTEAEEELKRFRQFYPAHELPPELREKK